MSITSLSFLLFIIAVFILYFVVPKRFQWVVLLVMSWVFYLSISVRAGIYVLFTATTVYAATRYFDKVLDRQKAYLKENKETLSKEDKKVIKSRNKRKRTAVMVITLLLNLGLLCVFKYFHFALEQINAIIGLFNGTQINDTFSLIAPLGISFYTFQSIGYLLDVYWEKTSSERNYFKALLFVSFFPQMTQGPISDFRQLSGELFTEHSFSYKRCSWGFQRMLWGFLKKMVIADALAPYVLNVFSNYGDYSGISTLIGAFMYSIQIYADFSGYMDIMCGFCEALGIRLTENFQRPYFSKSVTEYWRRWHISMGTWFKNYIYYPIGMSNWNRKLTKRLREKTNSRLSNTIPATLALLITWLSTGLWHGASWAYIVWGLVNGIFIIISLWMEPVYEGAKRLFKVKEETWLWRAFQTVRTFILVTFIKVLPEVGTLAAGLGLVTHIFVNHTIPHSLVELFPFLDFTLVTDVISFGLAILGTIAMFVASLLQRKKPVREYFNALPTPIRIIIIALIIILIATFGVKATWEGGGFMYAGF